MKNITLALCLTFLMAACSSGSSVSDLPPIVDGNYTGTYASNNTDANVDRGTMRLNLAQNQGNGDITGTFFVVPDDGISCLSNGSVEGSITGFNVRLTVEQTGIRNGDAVEGVLTFTLNAAGNILEGTYVSTGEVCSNQSGSGSVNLSR